MWALLRMTQFPADASWIMVKGFIVVIYVGFAYASFFWARSYLARVAL